MFHTARKKLTMWYVLILMSVSIAFSVVIYRGMAMEVERFARLQSIRFIRRFDELGVPAPLVIEDREFIDEMKQHIILVLLGINGVILVGMGGVAYFLAGKTLTPIKEMIDEQNRFVSDASHELKTPLTAMKSSLEVYLRDPKLTLQESKQVLRENIEEVDRLTSLSNSLLTLSETQNGNMKTSFSETHISHIIQRAIKQVAHTAFEKKIQIDTTQVPNHILVASEEKLAELFIILLDNAIKYSPEKSSINVTGSKKKKGIEIAIADKGIGIDEKDIPHVFERFYRSDSARERQKIGGYGLGLSIAKKIIDLHNGTIHIESVVNSGTMVRVWLPIS